MVWAGGCAYMKDVEKVEVYRSTRPVRPFRELGLVEGRREPNEQGQPTVMQLEFRMKAQAHYRGAHAVIDVREVADPYGNVYLVGTAIQYLDAVAYTSGSPAPAPGPGSAVPASAPAPQG
jgi:hypothetical protein